MHFSAPPHLHHAVGVMSHVYCKQHKRVFVLLSVRKYGLSFAIDVPKIHTTSQHKKTKG